jgi:Tfp pilus assembly protein PilW
VRLKSTNRRRGFTIGELIVGLSLSTIVMGGVLTSYLFVARAYNRTIGFGMANQPTLESQGRRTLAWFAQDVQMASAVTSPSASEVTLTVPRSDGGTKNVTYYYNSTAADVSVYSVTVLANSIARIDRNTNTSLTLHTSLLTCVFSYYDTTNNPYTTYVNYLPGIKQISFVFTAQAGSSVNSTLTQVYRVASPKLLLRNKALLP